MTSTHTSLKKSATGDKTDIIVTGTSDIPVSGGCTVTLYEDVGQTGTFDNSNTFELSGTTDEEITLSGFDGGGSTNDYWFYLELDGDGSDVTLSPSSLSRLGITTSDTAGYVRKTVDSVVQTENGVVSTV